MTATARQIGAIHAIAKKLGLAEDDYRALLQAETGQRSASALSAGQAVRVIDRLKGLQGASKVASNVPGAVTLDGPYAGKLRALWISGWHLGVVRDRTDRALLHFVSRQTGINHTRWLRDAIDARRAIEALKDWLAREGGVAWPVHEKGGRPPTALDLRRAVIVAQWRRLVDLGDVVPARAGDDPMVDERPSTAVFDGLLRAYAGQVARRNPRLLADIAELDAGELDAVIAALGGRLRRALARRAA